MSTDNALEALAPSGTVTSPIAVIEPSDLDYSCVKHAQPSEFNIF